MITLSFEKASAWVAFIVGIIIGIVVGFLGQPYVMEAFNNSLIFENQELKDKVGQLEQQLAKFSEEYVQPLKPPSVQPVPAMEPHHHRQTFNGVEITLVSCQKGASSEAHSIVCQFIINQPHDFITIYAYSTVLKAQPNVIGSAEAVQATGVSTLKTEEGDISSWKLLTPTAVPFTIRFRLPTDVATGSVELFVKPDQGKSTTVKFAPINIEVG
jgi:hypothetical protein